MQSKTYLLLIGLLLLVGSISGTTYNIYTNTTNWISILGSLHAGDTAIIHAGTYTKTAKLTLTLLGTAASPILITSAVGEAYPVISHTGQNQNIVDLVEGNYFTVQNLVLTGGSLGLRLGPSATNALSNGLIQNLTVHDTAETAISANFASHTYTNITFRHNEIYNTGTDTGECFYLGCVNAACIFCNSVVIDNYCHDTQQATAGSLGSAIQIKDGSYNNLVQDNVCARLGGPCVLLYTDQGKGRNRVIGNVVLSTNDNGIQAAAGATIVNNLVLNAAGDGIAIVQNPAGVTIANITLLHNTVVDPTGYCLRLTNFVATYPFLVANNALYCPNSAHGSINAAGNQSGVPYYANGYSGGSPPSGVGAGAFYVLGTETADLQNRAANNLYPTAGSLLRNKGNGNYSVTYDFNYKTRNAKTPTVGGYEYSTASNPGWAVTTGFKPYTAPH